MKHCSIAACSLLVLFFLGCSSPDGTPSHAIKIGSAKIVEPAPRALPYSGIEVPSKKTLVVIDPGHGGTDSGAIAHGAQEKSLALDTSKRLQSYLKKTGYYTVLTRAADTALNLYQRPEALNQYEDIILVSIHYNYADSASASGIETFYQNVASRTLANNVQREMIRATGAKNRGVKTAKFVVIRSSTRPAILVEGGFLTNSTEAKKVKQSSYRDKIALGIGRGVSQTVN